MLAVLLQHVDFTLAPDYVHAPKLVITLRPGNGMPMYLKPLGPEE